MANIDQALPQLYQNEGGYSNNPNDSGGETYRGISRNNFPNWEGWSIVDSYKPLHDEQIIHDEHLDVLVRVFYLDNFWDANNLGLINSQVVATKLLDMCVNMGSYRGVVILQQALVNDCRFAINIDGVLGKETLARTNQEGSGLIIYLRQRCSAFYAHLASVHPEDQQFLNGWLRRAEQ